MKKTGITLICAGLAALVASSFALAGDSDGKKADAPPIPTVKVESFNTYLKSCTPFTDHYTINDPQAPTMKYRYEKSVVGKSGDKCVRMQLSRETETNPKKFSTKLMRQMCAFSAEELAEVTYLPEKIDPNVRPSDEVLGHLRKAGEANRKECKETLVTAEEEAKMSLSEFLQQDLKKAPAARSKK